MTRTLMLVSALVLAARLCRADDPPKTSDDDARAKVDALETAMKGESASDKAAAIAACGQSPHAKTAAALGPILADPADDLRSAAATALGQMKGIPEAAKALEGGIAGNEAKEPVLVEIFKSIGAVGQASSVPVLQAWIDRKLRKEDTAKLPTVDAAIDCLGNLRFKKSVDACLALLKTAAASAPKMPKGVCAPDDGRLMGALGRLLEGQSHPTAAEWTSWWKKNEASYKDDLTPRKK